MMMKAAVYSSFSSPIEVKSVPRPSLTNTSKDAHAVIIQVKATGICRSVSMQYIIISGCNHLLINDFFVSHSFQS